MRHGLARRTVSCGNGQNPAHGQDNLPTSDTPMPVCSGPSAMHQKLARGTGAGLALPNADTEAMQLHLAEISRHVAGGAYAVLLLDRAGWHTTTSLAVPHNITLVFLPSRAPELNPVENIWQYMRANWLSNRVFETCEDIVDAACEAWRNLINQPTTINSIGMRDWAHVGHSQ